MASGVLVPRLLFFSRWGLSTGVQPLLSPWERDRRCCHGQVRDTLWGLLPGAFCFCLGEAGAQWVRGKEVAQAAGTSRGSWVPTQVTQRTQPECLGRLIIPVTACLAVGGELGGPSAGSDLPSPPHGQHLVG